VVAQAYDLRFCHRDPVRLVCSTKGRRTDPRHGERASRARL